METQMMDPNMMGPSMMAPEMPDEVKPSLGPDTVPDNGEYQPIVDYCIELHKRFSESKYREDKISEIKRSRETYEQIENAKTKDFPFKNASNITLPLTAITIDNLEPRVVSGLVGTKPVVRFEPENGMEPDEATKCIEGWFNKELENKVGIETRTMGIVHDILLEGTVYRLPKYDRDEMVKRDFVYMPNPMTGLPGIAIGPDGQPMTQDKVEATFEGGRFDSIPFSDLLCADDLGTPDEWDRADKIRIIRPTYGELMRGKNGVGYFPDRIGPWLLGQRNEGEISTEQQSPTQQVAGVKATGKKVIECLECYITFSPNRDLEKEETEQDDFTEDRFLVTVTLDTKTIIRMAYLRELNFSNECPIKRVRMFPEEGRSYGTSIYGKIKSIQDGSSDFFNAVLNIAYVVMLPWYFYEASSGLRGEQEIIPGKGVPVDSVKGILFPNFNISPAPYLNFIEFFVGLWERLGSVANPQIGRPDDSNKTATEIMMVVQEGNIKFDYQAKTIKEEFISIIQALYDLYYQHMPYDKAIDVGGQMVPLRPMMKRGYKFVLAGSTATANKMIERKEAEDLFGMSMQNPLINPMTAIEEVLKSRGKVDLKKWINPQVSQMVQAMMANPEIPQVVGNYLKTKEDTVLSVAEGGAPGGIKLGPAKRPGVPAV